VSRQDRRQPPVIATKSLQRKQQSGSGAGSAGSPRDDHKFVCAGRQYRRTSQAMNSVNIGDMAWLYSSNTLEHIARHKALCHVYINNRRETSDCNKYTLSIGGTLAARIACSVRRVQSRIIVIRSPIGRQLRVKALETLSCRDPVPWYRRIDQQLTRARMALATLSGYRRAT
jgi:hypothetical protein